MNLDDIKLGVSPLTERIYMGTLASPSTWKQKRDATSDFCRALLEWTEEGGLVKTINGSNGKEYEVTVRVIDNGATSEPVMPVAPNGVEPSDDACAISDAVRQMDDGFHQHHATPDRIWFDTEFIEDGKTIELLSIGMVRGDGSTYYAEVAGVDYERASPWVRENVIVHLTGEKKERSVIAAEVIRFAGRHPEFWAYYADYDWVVLCQLFGTMMDLPEGWPMFCRDIRQLAGTTRLPPQTTTEHHALADAIWTRDAHLLLAAAPVAPSGAREDGGLLACVTCGQPVES